MVEEFESDFLVLGSGIAGLCFALELASKGSVILLTKKEDFESNTNYAQGGIACVSTAEDSFEAHVQDTLRAGAGLCDERTVRELVRDGPPLVHQLIEWGVRFTTASKHPGEVAPQDLDLYDLAREGGHSHRRILHAKDLTGAEVERALLACLRDHPNVTFLEHHTAIDLLVGEGRVCQGALAMDSEGRGLKVFRAKVTLLATGGLGRIYLHTTNPMIATGDGIAMAWRAGLPVANLEFIQFHPTSFYSASGKTFLISEAVRGEEAILRRIDGVAFMKNYDDRADLAPRDIVARAIDTEMKKHGHPHVYLDCTAMTQEFFEERFPSIKNLCNSRGVNPPGEFIPVVPAAHYSCGGVVSDREAQTAMPGLLVAGEVAHTGIHGANRLASNSLLEALVFSHRAALSAKEYLPTAPKPTVPIPEWCQGWKGQQEIEMVRIEHSRGEIRWIMRDYVGIVRRTDRLELALDRLNLIQNEVEGYVAEGHITPSIIELQNMVQTAVLVVKSAISRHESRGLHYTLDYPEPLESEAHDTVLTHNP
ncbi:MAG: L-aspartate oxidase [Candidatus Omnitrophica bacterium]|nr:L-aspartate oxidase [Candidatus Omnitrophota bacterium]